MQLSSPLHLHVQPSPVILEKIPLYLIAYIFHFHDPRVLWRCASVCKKFKEAVYQLQLLKNTCMTFDRAETINKYLLPLFDGMHDLSLQSMAMGDVVRHCTLAVMMEAGIIPGYGAEDKVSHMVWQNCMRYKQLYNTKWLIQQSEASVEDSEDEIAISDSDDTSYPDDDGHEEEKDDNEINLEDYFVHDEDDEPRYKRHCSYWRHADRKRKYSEVNEFEKLAPYIK